MAKNLLEKEWSKPIIANFNKVLNYDISEMMLKDPENKLNLTEYA